MTSLERARWTLEVLTPIHIGAGDQHHLSKFEILQSSDDKKLIVIDQRKWINLLIKEGLIEDFLEFSLFKNCKLANWLKAKNLINKVRDFEAYQLPFQGNAISDLRPFL
ncbi:MAG: hypothetical protein HY692_05660, partial [Cyanobacteria bacterium NC_groundwater_1444_Ag_S-0.65um_54_12]|nr:hypothetical protein [Cyanobacteria bacterium NC_groundwater_1444_Ag_S-0.65um_54_12]